MRIRRLDWDSSFLGKNVGLIEVGTEFPQLLPEMKEYDLLYLFSESPIKPDNNFTSFFSTQLVDEKVTYFKTLNTNVERDPAVLALEKGYIADEHFINLAIQSGNYSRFHVDTLFPVEKFTELYRLWLTQSLNGIMADEVFVYMQNDIIAGFITVRIKGGVPDIGLLAVDSNYRGRGIAVKLIQSAESWARVEQKSNELQVVTQGSNLIASLVYEKLGFKLKMKQFVFHCWRK